MQSRSFFLFCCFLLFLIADAAYVRLPFAAIPSSSRTSTCNSNSRLLQSSVSTTTTTTATTTSDNKKVKVSSSSSSSVGSSSNSRAAAAPSTVVSWDWKQVAQSVFEQQDDGDGSGAVDDRPIILFDGHCNLCNGGVNFAIDHDPNGRFRFVSLQSRVGQSLLLRSGRNPDDISSIVLCFADGRALVESDAILQICQGLEFTDGVGPLVHVVATVAGPMIPRPIRNMLYHVVADNRYRFGETTQCRIDLDGEYDNRFVRDPPQHCNVK